MPEFGVDLDVADMRREAALGAGGVELMAGADRAAGLARLGGDLGQRQRRELAGIVAGGPRLAVLPDDRLRIDLPDLGRPLAQRA